MRRLLIVDGHPVTREGLRHLVDREADLAVCAEADSISSASDAISACIPDIVVSGLDLNHSNGMELIRTVRGNHPNLPILVMSFHEESIYAERILAMGANGYIMKQAPTEDILTAVRRVLSGGIFVSAAMTNAMTYAKRSGGSFSVSNPIERLTNRELQVLHMVGAGVSTRDIASELTLSVKTIEAHRQRMRRKLNLENGAQLLQYAIAWLVGHHSNASASPDDAFY